MLYERWLLELWHGDYDVADEILTPDFTGHWPDREVEGREALVELIRETHAMFSSLEFRMELGPIEDGDHLRVADGRFAEYWVASWAGTS